MAAPITANKQTANGKDSYWLVPAIADNANPLATEINSTSALNITGFIMAEQEGFGSDTSKATLPRLLVETSTAEGLDTTTWSMPDIVGAFDPQADASDNDKKFWELVKDGYTGKIVRRQNIVAATDSTVTAGQFVDVADIDIAPATPGKTSPNADGIYSFTAAAAIKNPKFNVAVA